MRRIAFLVALMMCMNMGFAVETNIQSSNITVDDIIVTNGVNATSFYQDGYAVLDTRYNSLSNFTNDAGYYNSSYFNITNYVSSTTLSSYGYYNSSDFSISDYFTKLQIIGFGYYNSSDFSIADYLTSLQILGFNYYNSSDFNITDYVSSTTLSSYGYYNSSDFNITNYYMKTEIDTQSEVEAIWGVTLANDSELSDGLAGQDECSEITNCVPNAWDAVGDIGADSLGGTQINESDLTCTEITGGAGLCDGTDADTTYTVGNGLTQDGTNISVDESYYFSFDNISAGYISGQPIDGSIGSAIIYVSEVDDNFNINVTHTSGTNITYPDFIVHIVDNSYNSVYCSFTSEEITVENEETDAYYVDTSCTLKNTSMSNYFNNVIYDGDNIDIFTVRAINNDVEFVKGRSIGIRESEKERTSTYKTQHLNVLSGMEINEETFPDIYQYSGQYSYLRSVLSTSAQNTSDTDNIHHVYHTSGSWTHDEINGVNLSACDDGTNAVTCASNLFRRYVFYTIGYSDGTDNTQIHELAPLTTDTTYSNIANCIDIENNPISYTLPNFDTESAVVNYIYCGQRDDTDWDGAWIDVRVGSGSGASPDISALLTVSTTFSGDVSGTYNSISLDCSDVAGTGLSCSGEDLIHNDTSSQASSDNSGRTYIQDIIVDTYGHITSLVTATETVTDTKLTEEEVEDYVGGMVTGNTETLITVTYQDADGTIDYVVNNDLHSYSWTNVVDSDITDSLTVTGYMQDTDIDTFSELNTWVTDATLLKSGGTLTTNKWCLYDGSGIDCNVEPVTDTDTTYTASGALLDLTGTVFSVNNGTLTNGKGCKYVTGTGLVCDQDYLTASPFGSSIDDTEMSAEDFGEFTCTGNEDGCTLDSGVYDDEYIELGDSFGGDVSGTYNSIAVADDSHNHTYATITQMTEANLYGLLNDVTEFIETGDNATVASLTSTDDTIYVSDSENDAYMYFYSDGSPTGEHIIFDEDYLGFKTMNFSSYILCEKNIESDANIVAHGHLVSTLDVQSNRDIYTTGEGDDFWLGSITQASALVQLYANGSAKLGAGAMINEYSTDGTLGGNSDIAVPTEKAVKTYADTKSPVAGSSSIVTVGNITTGEWSGTSIADSKIDDDITASNYLPLAGGTMTGNITVPDTFAITTTSGGGIKFGIPP